jgi:hypothetical protein
MLEEEVSKHDGSHGFGRHGYQTGWELQVIRAVTGITPDQSYDPRGIGPYIRTWNYDGSMFANTYDLFGERTVDFAGFEYQPDYGPSKSPQAAGGYISPEAQQKSIRKCEEVLSSISTYPAAQFTHKTNKKATLAVPITSVVIVVPGARDGAPYGIGFKPKGKGSVAKRTRQEVIALIEAFHERKTWNQVYPGKTASVNKFHVKDQVAFPQITDLFDYLGIEPMWQKTALGVFRRAFTPGAKTFSGWRRVTIFPCMDAPGWAPSLYVDDAKKAALAKAKLPAKGYAWTGGVGGFDSKVAKKFPVPAWA